MTTTAHAQPRSRELSRSRRNAWMLAAFLLSAVAADATIAAASEADEADNWPQWRGPGGRGFAENAGIPIEWSESDNVLWRTAIEGKGHSSPIVWGDRVFLTTAIRGVEVEGKKHPMTHFMMGQEFLHPDSGDAEFIHTFKVICLDAETGEILWSRVAFEGNPDDDRHQRSSYASPTAATDGEHVYAYFGSQGLYAYDFDGNEVWSAEIGLGRHERYRRRNVARHP